ncbi:MAG: hypothetical protein M5T61_21210 [Acidimicrobiia bacterium]|nr:hypothetical protein [Acidimicrobiia bacterium]
MTATRVALIVALAVWAASLLAGRNPVRGTRLTILFVVLIAWMVATVLVARDLLASGAEGCFAGRPRWSPSSWPCIFCPRIRGDG